MSLAILEMPDEPVARAAWLESRLLGSSLTTLAAELALIHGTRGNPGITLDAVLDASTLGEVCQVGMGALSDVQLEALLSQPVLLMQLQEHVLLEGGSHWENVLREDAQISAAVERSRQQLSPRMTVEPKADSPKKRRRPLWDVQTVLLVLTTAAAVLLGVTLWRQPGRSRDPAEAAWGWQRAGALPQEATRAEYLTALADAAQQWFAQEPDDALELGKRIGQMRQGCTTLLLSKHTPLDAADQAWLKDRCQKWARKLEVDLAALEAGEEPRKVRASVDATVTQLVRALREKART